MVVKHTAATNPQLAPGPQKWVGFGPTGLFKNARNEAMFDYWIFKIALHKVNNKRFKTFIVEEIWFQEYIWIKPKTKITLFFGFSKQQKL